jgi:hypothetical protein
MNATTTVLGYRNPIPEAKDIFMSGTVSLLLVSAVSWGFNWDWRLPVAFLCGQVAFLTNWWLSLQTHNQILAKESAIIVGELEKHHEKIITAYTKVEAEDPYESHLEVN